MDGYPFTSQLEQEENFLVYLAIFKIFLQYCQMFL